MKTQTSSFFCLTGILSIMSFFMLEGYLTLLNPDDALLPLTFGNFKHVRALLEMAPPKDDFTFAVAGDTRGTGTYGNIVRELKREKPDFVVLLGDCAYHGTAPEHHYLQTMMKTDYALPCPVFYVLGNHDVSRDTFPVARFETTYGPSIFSFEYGRCLFIVLRIMEAPASNRESIEFLNRISSQDNGSYRYRFVFMHIPPAVSDDFQARKILESDELIGLFEKLRIDCVFTGDYHGYARIKKGTTGYLITGGAGARLDGGKGRQFHHAVLIHVGKDSFSERIIPVEKRLDPWAVLERFVIVRFQPWVSSHGTGVLVVNMLAFLILLTLFILMKWTKTPHG